MMRRVQYALLTAAAVVGFVSNASASDLPVKAPAYRPVPVAVVVPLWTGWYVGGNAGYGWDNKDVTFTGDPAGFGAAITAGAVPGTLTPKGKGGLGGIQAGYNYQMGPGVIGVEADFDFASIRGSDSFTSSPIFGSIVTTADRKISSLGTVRARAGFLPWNPLLLYVTGGLAYGDTKLETSVTNGVIGGGCLVVPGCISASSSGTKAGWTAGAGAEWMFAPKWSLKAEYLYVDLGSRSATMSTPLGGPGNFYTATTKFQENIVRGGINYHF